MVVPRFLEVPNHDEPVPTFEGTPYGEAQFNTVVKVVPVKEMRTVSLSWPLPTQQTTAHYGTKPTRYLAHLAGHESAGSILAHLKNLGWADSLSAGEGNAGSDFSSFQISVELTEEGLGHWEDVVHIACSYVERLKAEGVSEEVWNEERDV